MSFWVGVGEGYKCQLSVNSIQTLQNVVGVLKKEVAFYCLFEGRGIGEEARKMEFPILFSAPHFLFHSAATAVRCN